MDSYLQDNSGDMQYSASNPVRTEFHFSALHHHGDYDVVLWAELWFVVCGLWFVVCGLWFVVCGLWFVVCGLWFVSVR
jgi:hypothetical protein